MSGHYRNTTTGNAVKIIQVSQQYYSLGEKGHYQSMSADDLATLINSGALVKERHLGDRRRIKH